MNVVMSLLPSHDALLLQEVHGTSGMLEAWPRPVVIKHSSRLARTRAAQGMAYYYPNYVCRISKTHLKLQKRGKVVR